MRGQKPTCLLGTNSSNWRYKSTIHLRKALVKYTCAIHFCNTLSRYTCAVNLRGTMQDTWYMHYCTR